MTKNNFVAEVAFKDRALLQGLSCEICEFFQNTHTLRNLEMTHHVSTFKMCSRSG